MAARDAEADGDEGGTARRSGAQSIERAMTVLRCFDDEVDGLTLSELAHRTGIAVSTTHRILRAMCRAGFLDQDPRTERYFLARATAILGQVAARNLGFERASARLERLAVDAHESASLGIHDGYAVVVLLRSQAVHRLRFDRPLGTRVWMHASAMGKALLAFPRRGDLEASLAALPDDLPRFTEHTITDRDALLAELRAVRARGYAVNDREQDVGFRAIGAPILGPQGWAHAAVAVQGPVARVDDARVRALGTLVIEAASDLAGVLQLGRLPPAPDPERGAAVPSAGTARHPLTGSRPVPVRLVRSAGRRRRPRGGRDRRAVSGPGPTGNDGTVMIARNPPDASGRPLGAADPAPSEPTYWTAAGPGRAPIAGARVPHWRAVPPTPVRERLVVVAVRPGEETLTAAGLMLWCAHHDIEVVIAALTDGETARGRAGSAAGRTQVSERDAALEVLDLPAGVRRFGLTGADVWSRRDEVAARLERLLDDRTVCVAPWRLDGPPELAAASRAADTAAHGRGAALWEAPLWGRLDGRFDLSRSGRSARALDLGPVLRARKQAAVAAFERPLIPRDTAHAAVVAARAVQALTTSVEWFCCP